MQLCQLTDSYITIQLMKTSAKDQSEKVLKAHGFLSIKESKSSLNAKCIMIHHTRKGDYVRFSGPDHESWIRVRLADNSVSIVVYLTLRGYVIINCRVDHATMENLLVSLYKDWL